MGQKSSFNNQLRTRLQIDKLSFKYVISWGFSRKNSNANTFLFSKYKSVKPSRC